MVICSRESFDDVPLLSVSSWVKDRNNWLELLIQGSNIPTVLNHMLVLMHILANTVISKSSEHVNLKT